MKRLSIPAGKSTKRASLLLGTRNASRNLTCRLLEKKGSVSKQRIRGKPVEKRPFVRKMESAMKQELSKVDCGHSELKT